MNVCIVACATLRTELLCAMAHTGCTVPIYWLEAGQHNRKDARRAEIQSVLDACSDCDTVLLAATLCGGCVTGLKTHNFRLVIPRCDDCITLLLGSPEVRRSHPATYFLTEGWLSGKDSIRQEYRRSLEKHGQQRTDRIFSAMLANYERMAFVDTDSSKESRPVQELAGIFGLSYTRIPGTLSWLEELLTGSWDTARFVVLEPETTLTESLCHPQHRVTVLPENRMLFAPHGTNLLQFLQHHSYAPDAPCGGNGSCGKCRVLVDGQDALACQTEITCDITVTIPKKDMLHVLQTGIREIVTLQPLASGHLLAFDIGTTSVACCLLSGTTGAELASAGASNPQSVYGADVITRIRAAQSGKMDALTASIRTCMTALTEAVCKTAEISFNEIGVVSVVGNPAMQQLFLGIRPDNLATVPYPPVLTTAAVEACGDRLPLCPNALLLTVPDISGFVGADTLGCILATELYKKDEITLMVDIGTNGEMVLGNKDRMIACSTAAGPALEGANIQFGMRGTDGAIDHVWVENGEMKCSVIGGGQAIGICGSGIIDATAAALELELLNRRGRIRNEKRIIDLSDGIYLTQEDIRQIQMAKGAIHVGIELMCRQMGISLSRIDRVLLAGAFGFHIKPECACRMGLLPGELEDRVCAVGNAALTGAKMLAKDGNLLETTGELVKKIEFLELATQEDFPKTFARAMGFAV